MQQKGEAWKVLHHLYITYKEGKKIIMHNTKQLSPSYHSHMHTTQQNTVCLRNSKGKEKKICTNVVYIVEMKPTSLDHLTCLNKIKARNTRNTTDNKV